MNEFIKRYRSILNAVALILMLLIPFLSYVAAAGESSLLTPALVIMAGVTLYVSKNG